jgi:hypothetical protein
LGGSRRVPSLKMDRIKKIESRLHQLLPASVHVIITNEKGSTDRGPPSASEHGGMANGGGVHVANMTRAPAGAGSQVQLWSRMRGSRRCSARAFLHWEHASVHHKVTSSLRFCLCVVRTSLFSLFSIQIFVNVKYYRREVVCLCSYLNR